jgi:hypothetical protein
MSANVSRNDCEQRKNHREQQHTERPSQRKTQASRILARLIEARGDWISVIAISIDLGILQFSARLPELRAIGFIIENRMELMADGTKHSFYRLRSSAGDVEKLSVMPAPAMPAKNEVASAQSPAKPALESSDRIPTAPAPDVPAPEAADWFTEQTGKRRAVVERESLWLWERQ